MILDNLLKALASLLSIDYTDLENNDLFTLTELKRWVNAGKDEAVAHHPWPFTEGRREIIVVGEQYDYPTGMKSDSLIFLTVGDKRYEKLRFEDYLIYKEDYPSGNDRVYSDRARILHINVLADGFSGSVVTYGQMIVDDMVSTTVASTVFSYAEPEGDQAVIKLAYASALESDKLKDLTKARVQRAEAFEILDRIWERIGGRQHTYKTKNRPLFKRFDVLGGGLDNEIRKRNQF